MSKGPKTVTVELDYPIEHEGKTISSLTFRRMKAKDSLVAEDTESQARAGIALFAALADVDVAVIEELDLEDFQKLAKAAEPLMGKIGAAAMEALQNSAE
ncbi:Phage tail assembly chaperone protein, E, or 41 or 14 [Cohaesibacter sp. ES.047]|uniref:phage tail assembly protein n=1 Tax=Cohaesibacter sp. ES.047 TaxID=1798205 RepID=UPI000BB92BEA|nr:phage tail assembly protein [Cohaesibacter sp. ES.047]SNY94050.1 Phage tail assembly chaperone protein, E, or 41 or 14 [Cohaesibacter sp. ES.047]